MRKALRSGREVLLSQQELLDDLPASWEEVLSPGSL